jgi:soluble lytic murein transglycosylase-like protein
MKRILHLIGTGALAAAMGPFAFGAEFAVLRTGFRLHADRHEVEAGKVRLYSNGGVTELAETSIVAFEPDDAVEALAPGPESLAPTSPLPSGAVPDARAVPDAGTAPIGTPQEMAGIAAKKYSLPESFVRSVMKAESGFQPAALSPKGAIGLMQLMPATAKTLGVDPHDPSQNADGGAKYLRELLAKYEDDPDQVLLALAAYNAGPAAVARFHGVPPYRETREYILRVLKDWDAQKSPAPKRDRDGAASAGSGN